MQLNLTKNQYRRLLDLVYIGNWIINSRREDSDHIKDFDDIESLLFSKCAEAGMPSLAVKSADGSITPSQAFVDGGIHEVIGVYEDEVFFEILAQELSLRDVGEEEVTSENYNEVCEKMEQYLEEFTDNGCDHVYISGMDDES